MPIILEDNAGLQAQSTAPAKQQVQYGPKDYNTILTGNGINQGLLRSTLTAGGTDPMSKTAMSILAAEKSNSTNKSHHVHDDLKTYTTLHQDISLCGGFGLFTNNGGNPPVLPMRLITDHFITFENNKKETVTFRSRLFLNRVYVYKAAANYVCCAYTLAVGDEQGLMGNYVEAYDALYAAVKSNDPITDMYTKIAARVVKDMAAKGYAPCMDDSAAQAGADKSRSLYDLIMSELAIIKTQGDLEYALRTASAAGFEVLKYANNILNLVNLPFSLYQSDVVDVVNARAPEEAKTLKNANMSLSLADTLSSMQGQLNAQIPELVGKKYTTNQMVLTTEQTAAIESPSLVTIVAAGAGTGKSSCIMHRLAFMEENGCDMKQTFVLSFTKAAAGHIRKNFKDCKSSTIADFTHNFVNVILEDPSNPGARVDIIAHSDFAQKFRITVDDLDKAGILPPDTMKALKDFRTYVENIEGSQAKLLDMLDLSLNPQANNILSVLKMMHCSSLELDPIIFHTQLSLLKPNIEHIVIDESQDSNRLEFLTMLKMAMMHNISIYIVGDCAQTLYEFRDADPRILNNLTKLFNTYDLSINHRSTQIILDVANLMSSTMSTHKTTLRANQVMQITKQAVDDTIVMNTYDKVTDPATIKILDDWLELRLGKGQSIAVIARSGNDVLKLYDYLNTRYGSQYSVQNITSQRRNDITILSAIGGNMPKFLPDPASPPQGHQAGTPVIPGWSDFERLVQDENIRLNSMQRGGNRYNQNGPTVNKVVMDWLAAQQADGPKILAALNDPAQRDGEIRKLQMSLLDAQTEKNNLLQRVMDAKNAKLKEQKADIVVCTVHGVKGLEYDHVACFINTESGRSGSGNSDENKRIGYVALTRAKLTECVFCSREKLLKDFEAYRAAQP